MSRFKRSEIVGYHSRIYISDGYHLNIVLSFRDVKLVIAFSPSQIGEGEKRIYCFILLALV